MVKKIERAFGVSQGAHASKLTLGLARLFKVRVPLTSTSELSDCNDILDVKTSTSTYGRPRVYDTRDVLGTKRSVLHVQAPSCYFSSSGVSYMVYLTEEKGVFNPGSFYFYFFGVLNPGEDSVILVAPGSEVYIHEKHATECDSGVI